MDTKTRRLGLAAIAAAVSTLLGACAVAITTNDLKPVAATTPTVRLMTYDVCSVYCDGKGLTKWTSGRADAVAASIKAKSPDVVGLQDAGDATRLAALSKALGTTYKLGANYSTTGWAGVATYYKVSTMTPTKISSGFMIKATSQSTERGATFQGLTQKATGKVFTVANIDSTTSGSAQNDTDRVSEVKALLAKLQNGTTSATRGRILWVGNFNSFSKPTGTNRTGVYNWFKSNTYVDSWEKATKKVDPEIDTYNHYDKQDSKYRASLHMDHIYVPDTLKVTNWETVRSPLRTSQSKFQSNHNLVIADVDLVNAGTTPPPTPPPATTGKVSKVVVIIEENHSKKQMKADFPTGWAMSQKYGYAEEFYAITHPSNPNYIALFFGGTNGVNKNGVPSDWKINAPSAFGRAIVAGKTAKVYNDGMSGTCAQSNGGTKYAVRHSPWPYADSETALCKEFSVPLAHLADDVKNGMPNVSLIIPNNCNNAHDCSLATADKFFKTQVDAIMAGPDYKAGKLAIVLTADEDDKKSNNNILTAVIHPSQKGNVVTEKLTLYSLTRLFGEVTHTTPVGAGATAASMAKAFGLPIA